MKKIPVLLLSDKIRPVSELLAELEALSALDPVTTPKPKTHHDNVMMKAEAGSLPPECAARNGADNNRRLRRVCGRAPVSSHPRRGTPVSVNGAAGFGPKAKVQRVTH